MASIISSNVHFDFESEIPESSGICFSGGGVGDSGAANVPNPDTCMADTEGNNDPLETHGLVDMQDFGRVTARVDVLEGTLRTMNTNLTNLTTLFEQFVARFASIVAGLGTPGGAIPVVTPPIVPTP